MNLINTVIEDGKPGQYVSYTSKNPYGVSGHYIPHEYQRCAKVVTYCYDNGDIEVQGIGDMMYGERNYFDSGKHIGEFQEHVSYWNNVEALNEWLPVMYPDETIDSIDNDAFSINREHLAPRFLDLIEYMRNLDPHTEPEPWGNMGFMYYSQKEDDGKEWYYIVAAVEKKQHGRVECKS